MNQAGLPTLRFLSHNVNSMRGAGRRRVLFGTLMDEGYDVVALQETHQAADRLEPPAGGAGSSEGDEWAREGAGPTRPWPGTAFWAPWVHGQRGVALLFSERAVQDLEPRFLTADPQGRYISVTCTFDGQPFTVTSVYAPCTPEGRCAFFTQSLLPQLDPSHTHLAGGDFNCIADPFRDQTRPQPPPLPGGAAQPPPPQRRCVGYVGGLQAIEDALGLVDCWRELHPEEASGGFTHGSPGSMARLDRWLASPSVQAWVGDAGVVHGLPGDHLGVALTLVARKSAARGPGMWRLTPWVCSDPDFRSFMEAHIPGFWQDHPAAEGTHRQRWEHFKVWVRDLSQSFTIARARQVKAASRALLVAVEEAYTAVCMAPHCPLRFVAWQLAKAALTALRETQAEEAAAKAGFLLEHLGERPTAWFHRLHKQRQASTTITHITPPGETVAVPLAAPGGKAAAEAAFTSYFSAAAPGGMFAERPVVLESQDRLLDALDTRLSDEQQAICDADISRDELQAALLGTDNNKSPGSDGLPYEFYRAFWHLVGQPLLQCFQEAFAAPEANSLAPSQRVGIITLLFKGNEQPRDQPASYRPITLLNTDYKIMARALACRWGPAADAVVDQTQTAFIPNRWIGDNVLAHLEEVDFCHLCQVQGVVLFIDSAKAYDRLDVGWLLRCLESFGFGPNARRWVSLLHSGRRACVRFNGWRTAPFPISSGVAQGSPLSPLLYVLAAQPLAAHLRGLAVMGHLRGIPFPDGSCAPLSHQHADDLTVHVSTLVDAQVVMQGPIRLFCEASGAEVHAGKARGLHLGVPRPFVGVDVGTGIRFVGPDEPIRHLGVLLGSDVEACRAALYDTLAARLERRVASWATASLSLFGRAYVARQCMASIFTYHATFVPPPPTFLTRAADLFATFVQMGVRADPGRIGGKLYPNRAVSALPWEQGGMRFPDVHGIVIALQSSVISRLLRPQQAAWKLMLIQWLGRPSTWVQDHPDVPARDIDCWGLGVRALFCTPELPLHTLPDAALIGGVPARVLSYIRAFRRLLPHRDTPATTFAAIMAEPLFFNTAVCNEVGRPLGGPQWRHCAASGVRRVGDLRRLYRAPPGTAPPHQVEALLQALPLAWRALVLQPEEPIPEWAAWGGHPGRFLRRLDPVSPGTCMMLQVYRMLIQGGGASCRLTATGDFLPPAEVCHACLLPAIFFYLFFFFFCGESPLHVQGHAEANHGGPNADY